MKLIAAKRFLKACRAGANVAQMDAMLADIRRDEQILSDAQIVIEALHSYCPDSSDGIAEVAALLARARELMETA